MKTNKLKINKFVKKVYYDSDQNIKYIIAKRLIDGMLKIKIINYNNHSTKKIIRFRRDEDFFKYYVLFDNGQFITKRKK